MFCENSNVKRQNFFLDQRDIVLRLISGYQPLRISWLSPRRGIKWYGMSCDRHMIKRCRTLPVYDNGRGFENTFCLVYQIKFSNLKIHVSNIALIQNFRGDQGPPNFEQLFGPKKFKILKILRTVRELIVQTLIADSFFEWTFDIASFLELENRIKWIGYEIWIFHPSVWFGSFNWHFLTFCLKCLNSWKY